MSQAVADRNLLFGIVALQMDFITRDGLIGAMNAWALEKHRPLADLGYRPDSCENIRLSPGG
jgi:hypothetical protein